jgi:toxin ParE1/3/4
MIQIDPEAGLEILDARDYYEAERPGLGRNFLLAADGLLDVIERDWMAFPVHPFARTPDVRRAHFPRPWPYAFAFLVRAQEPLVLACEHLRRMPMYWAARLRSR